MDRTEKLTVGETHRIISPMSVYTTPHFTKPNTNPPNTNTRPREKIDREKRERGKKKKKGRRGKLVLKPLKLDQA